jgi:hypothetical protein
MFSSIQVPLAFHALGVLMARRVAVQVCTRMPDSHGGISRVCALASRRLQPNDFGVQRGVTMQSRVTASSLAQTLVMR